MGRHWTPQELALIDSTTARRHKTRKLTDEQIKAIRERVDSMTIPWTPNELAELYGVTPRAITYIARRMRWPDRVREPQGQQYWREKEIEEMLDKPS